MLLVSYALLLQLLTNYKHQPSPRFQPWDKPQMKKTTKPF